MKTVAVSTGAFYLIHNACRFLFSRTSATYRALDEAGKQEWGLYGASFAHAIGVTGFCLREFAKDWAAYKTKPKVSDPVAEKRALEQRKTKARHFLAAMLGYFVNDLYQSRAVWMKDPANLMHHAGAISILSAGMQIRSSLLEFTPYVTFVESTTILLNLGWFAKQSKQPKHVVDNIFKAFALGFLLVRVFGMSAVVGHLAFRREKQMAELGIGRFGLYLVVAMQYWWFSKIARMALAK
eukprot:CAMPEP_0114620812 /NCGR_PEP_ID=MMETSP0168-20121206/8915_1 /TAXON_ID=95228 ORGANISM="Vannella sp., Strain DIVA3 517/6/12" /NCGR_SAMPLE_ID=MMETSP0168 /ASSEMBLY_ACC=CAM_ASM_000044 /LENGTH=238 /DNA_ID=CAMNT_0001832009 /DNA_START=127 /DNA_END=843 /DNA_ORIENTATION=+